MNVFISLKSVAVVGFKINTYRPKHVVKGLIFCGNDSILSLFSVNLVETLSQSTTVRYDIVEK